MVEKIMFKVTQLLYTLICKDLEENISVHFIACKLRVSKIYLSQFYD